MNLKISFGNQKSAETFYSNLPTSVNDPMAQLFKTSMQTVIKSRSRSSLSEKLPAILEINIEKQMTFVDKNFTFPCFCWFHCTIYRTVWNGMGNNEFFSIYCNIQKY